MVSTGIPTCRLRGVTVAQATCSGESMAQVKSPRVTFVGSGRAPVGWSRREVVKALKRPSLLRLRGIDSLLTLPEVLVIKRRDLDSRAVLDAPSPSLRSASGIKNPPAFHTAADRLPIIPCLRGNEFNEQD